MADRIDQLPNKNQPPNNIDIQAMQQLFKNTNQNKSGFNIKNALIPTIVFILLSLPLVDSLIKTHIGDSDTLSLFIKAVIFLLFFLIFQYMTS